MSEELEPVERLIERLQAGIDLEESFRKLFQLYHSSVEAFFRRKYFLPEESRDLAQETFLRVFKSLPSFRRDSSFPVWLFGIMHHVYLNEVRKRRSEKRRGLEVSVDTSGYEERPSPELAAAEAGPLYTLISRERSKAFQEALQEFPEQMRLCCILRFEEGYKYQEIAGLMGISIETVKSHLHQARKRLIEKLGGAELS